jgi:hypothetical protein
MTMHGSRHIGLFGLLLLATCGFAVGCDKDDPESTPDYIVFGTFFGECIGEQCVEIYRLSATDLSEDTTDQYPNSLTPVVGDWALLPQAKFDAVKDIIGPLPEALLNEAENVIGQPDAGDWGGAYLEWKEGDLHRFWLLDLNRNNLPEQYDALVTQIQSAVDVIHE